MRGIANVKYKKCRAWDPGSFACWGALAGMTLAIVVEAYDVFSGRFNDVDPFIHILVEMTVFTSGGAMLFAAIAEMRNRTMRR